MFEGFSFASPSSRASSLRVPDDESFPHYESNLVSPLSSRCPSPRLGSRDYSSRITKRSRSPFHRGPAPTSIPPSYASQHRLSIGSLTRKLNSQSLDHNDLSSDSDDSRGFPRTPQNGYLERSPSLFGVDRKPSIAFISPQYGDKQDAYIPAHFDLSPTSSPRSSWDRRCSHPSSSPTSAPNALLTPPYGSIDSGKHRLSIPGLRSQRERLSILQCASTSVADTIRLAQILDEDEQYRHYEDDLPHDSPHPSSLPPSRTPSRRLSKRPGSPKSSASSKLSITSAGKSKIDKSYAYSDRRTGRAGPTGLRRRSLVLAAVTAVLEADSAAKHRDSIAKPSMSNHLQPLDGGCGRSLSQTALT